MEDGKFIIKVKYGDQVIKTRIVEANENVTETALGMRDDVAACLNVEWEVFDNKCEGNY